MSIKLCLQSLHEYIQQYQSSLTTRPDTHYEQCDSNTLLFFDAGHFEGMLGDSRTQHQAIISRWFQLSTL